MLNLLLLLDFRNVLDGRVASDLNLISDIMGHIITVVEAMRHLVLLVHLSDGMGGKRHETFCPFPESILVTEVT